jgi:integrase/recombinase XerD
MPPAQTSAHVTSQSALAPAVNAWRIYLEDQGNSSHTVKAFAADVLLLGTYLPPDRPVGSISTADINNFLNWMQTGRGVPCSPKTLSRRITSIKAFFRWLHKYGAVLLDPAEKIVQRSVISPLPVVLSPEDVQAALQVTQKHREQSKPDARPHALLLLLLETGIKKTECLALSPNHVDLEDPDGPILFVRYASPAHRYKERKIALSDAWVKVYHEYKAQYGINETIFPWSPRRLEYILEDIGEEAALDKHLSFDMCRWTCALSDYLSDVEPNKIRQKLGISKIQWREVRMKLEQLAKGGEPKVEE